MFLEKQFLENLYLEKIVPRKGALERMTESDWELVLDQNLTVLAQLKLFE
jgi:hypothetical protein